MAKRKKAITKLYTGATGCGKTYKAITETEADAKSFVMLVPCRQLAYEIFYDYPQVSRVDTGEVHFGDRQGNCVCVYEGLGNEVIAQDTLIVDEAHYLNDEDRGGALFEKILINRRAGKEIILLTATDTLSKEVKAILNVEETVLQPFTDVPEKIGIGVGEFCRKVKVGMSAIVFTKFVPKADEVAWYLEHFGLDASSVGVLSADTPSFERVTTQFDFKSGKLQVVIATNVLAQGLNFPAEGVLIEYNEHDDWALVTQKLGRIARPLFGLKTGYFSVKSIPPRVEAQGVPQKIERGTNVYTRPSGDIIDISKWGFMLHEVPTDVRMYKNYKYGYRFLRELKHRTRYLEQEEKEALEFLKTQQALLCDLFERRDEELGRPVRRLRRAAA
ncbi:MAG: hypothetical protein RLZZ234_605 [Candidatus Parcubacteria bacterium]|jgi:superfamily II DNA or RNA helicase